MKKIIIQIITFLFADAFYKFGDILEKKFTLGVRFSNVTPQQKIESVTKKLGIPGIKKQQGTTRIIYDSLPLDGRTTFRFFEGSNSRVFPFTNVGSFGNKLEVGETMGVQYAYLSFFTATIPPPPEVPTFSAPVPAAIDSVQIGDINLSIGNVQVVKPMPVVSWSPIFNKNCASNSNLFIFDTDVIIPPLLEFVAELRTPFPESFPDSFLRLTFEGVGSIINTRQTY